VSRCPRTEDTRGAELDVATGTGRMDRRADVTAPGATRRPRWARVVASAVPAGRTAPTTASDPTP